MKHVCMAVLFFALYSSVWASNVAIKLNTTKGTSVIREVSETIRSITFYDADSQGYSISGISGLGKLPNLEEISFYNLPNIADYSFLGEVKSLKRLYISSCTISSLMFIQSLTSLVYLHLDIYIRDGSTQSIIAERIDLSEHNKIEFIQFCSGGVLRGPTFYNITTKPYLDIRNNQISSLTSNDIELLNQYSIISLKYNPIVDNAFERAKLKKLTVQYDNTFPLPERILAIYHEFN